MSPAARGLLSSPVMWVVGAAGFLARGGILVLALPILSLPTPVGVTLLVPPLSVTTSGISSAFVPELLAAGAFSVLVVALGLLLGALADAVVYQQLAGLARTHAVAARDVVAHDVATHDVATHTSILPATMPGPRGGAPRLVAKLIGVEILALLPAIAMSIITVSRLIAVGEQEYLLPSSTSVPYVARVLQGASTALIALGACLLLADVVNALLSRRLLRGAYRAEAVPTAGRPRPTARAAQALRGAARIAATWLAAWLVTIVSLVPGLLAITLAWPAVRDAYAATLSSAPPGPVELVAATLAFVAAWLVALLVAGAGSALRAAAWSSGRLP